MIYCCNTCIVFCITPMARELVHAQGHIGNSTPTRNRGQSEVKRSRRNFEAGQAVKVEIRGKFRNGQGSPGDRWAWSMLDSQRSRDFRCGQGVKHENLMGNDLDRGRGWKYRRLCSVTPLMHMSCTSRMQLHSPASVSNNTHPN